MISNLPLRPFDDGLTTPIRHEADALTAYLGTRSIRPIPAPAAGYSANSGSAPVRAGSPDESRQTSGPDRPVLGAAHPRRLVRPSAGTGNKLRSTCRNVREYLAKGNSPAAHEAYRSETVGCRRRVAPGATAKMASAGRSAPAQHPTSHARPMTAP